MLKYKNYHMNGTISGIRDIEQKTQLSKRKSSIVNYKIAPPKPKITFNSSNSILNLDESGSLELRQKINEEISPERATLFQKTERSLQSYIKDNIKELSTEQLRKLASSGSRTQNFAESNKKSYTPTHQLKQSSVFIDDINSPKKKKLKSNKSSDNTEISNKTNFIYSAKNSNAKKNIFLESSSIVSNGEDEVGLLKKNNSVLLKGDRLHKYSNIKNNHTSTSKDKENPITLRRRYSEDYSVSNNLIQNNSTQYLSKGGETETLKRKVNSVSNTKAIGIKDPSHKISKFQDLVNYENNRKKFEHLSREEVDFLRKDVELNQTISSEKSKKSTDVMITRAKKVVVKKGKFCLIYFS